MTTPQQSEQAETPVVGWETLIHLAQDYAVATADETDVAGINVAFNRLAETAKLTVNALAVSQAENKRITAVHDKHCCLEYCPERERRDAIDAAMMEDGQ